MTYKIYTDGAYSSIRNQGGIAFTILDETEKEICTKFKTFKNTTNNRMELIAVIYALKMFKEKVTVTVISDSQYVVSGYNENWTKNKNSDLWDILIPLIEKHDTTLEWVKGHDKNKYNEKVDLLALQASHEK